MNFNTILSTPGCQSVSFCAGLVVSSVGLVVTFSYHCCKAGQAKACSEGCIGVGSPVVRHPVVGESSKHSEIR